MNDLPHTDKTTSHQPLRRELGLFDAVLLGLGSIVGTGVYVSLGLVIGLAGSLTLPVIVTAGLIAVCNGLSSAQLAAIHPVSGGTYEYGYRFLGPWPGRIAGWMFLVAKSASAATAALGVAGLLGLDRVVSAKSVYPSQLKSDLLIIYPVDISLGPFSISLDLTHSAALQYLAPAAAVIVVICLGLLTHAGVRRTSWANAALVAVGVIPLLAFVFVVGLIPKLMGATFYSGTEPTGTSTGAAVALAFVAFTGYGRVATLGEEVTQPRKTIPIAVILTLLCCLTLYLAVGWACFAVASDISVDDYGISSRPLLNAVKIWDNGQTALRSAMLVGGTAAMLGVILNLILGLSRVVLAMARRGDLPRRFATVQVDGRSPGWAVFLVTTCIAVIAAIGGIRTSWTVSALTVLVYYAITNWAAISVPPEDRFIPAWVSAAGLAGCLFFAPFALIELF